MNDNENSNPGWRRRRAARPAHGGPARSSGDAEWRKAAALMLLAGVLSLIATGDRPDVPLRTGPVTTPMGEGPLWLMGPAVIHEARRSMMERTPPSGTTVTPSWEPVTAPAGESAASPTWTSDAGFHPASDGRQAWSIGDRLHQVESWIRRYPWPTVTLGVIAGLLLARWRR